jgi:hypothetical protein
MTYKKGRGKMCPTAAETHANLLSSMYGIKALAKAKDKLNDAPFLMHGDVDFWRQVVAALEAN